MEQRRFTPIAEIGEFGLIEKLSTYSGKTPGDAILAGIGDDAAVYRIGNGNVHVLTTDALIEGVHFDRMFTPLRYLGFKAISVNVSDVVAMNARPKYATIALGIPHNLSVEMVEEIYQGVHRACMFYDMTLIGGDTTAARSLTLSITVVGEAEETSVTYRKGARDGDLLCVTGDLGGAYAGLKVLIENKKAFQSGLGENTQPDLKPFEYVIERHFTPTARIDVTKDWASVGVVPHAVIDISDGLASEIHHICEKSNCGAIVHTVALPIAIPTRQAADQLGEDPDTFALYGGEDYELLFSISEDQAEKLDRRLFNAIGRITAPEHGVQLQLPDGGTMPLEAAGFKHFGS